MPVNNIVSGFPKIQNKWLASVIGRFSFVPPSFQDYIGLFVISQYFLGLFRELGKNCVQGEEQGAFGLG